MGFVELALVYVFGFCVLAVTMFVGQVVVRVWHNKVTPWIDKHFGSGFYWFF